jgi:hypothetical protein
MNEQQLIEQRQRQLAEVYDPQEQFIQQQKAALPGMFEGQRSSLEQAKVNAFRDIGNTAQRRGMFFSGFQPAEQARYLGERFLPGMQDITARQEQARLGLLEQLIGLRGQRAGEMTKFQEQLRQEALQRQMQEEAIQRQQQAQMQAQRSGGGGGGMSISDQIRVADFSSKQDQQVRNTEQQKLSAQSEVSDMMSRKNTRSFLDEMKAIATSASYGNVKDQMKLEILRVTQPGLFLGNGALNLQRVNQLYSVFQ